MFVKDLCVVSLATRLWKGLALNTSVTKICLVLGLSCLVSATTGCWNKSQGPKDRARVSGSVTFNGQPLPAGKIVFSSTEGPNATPVSIRAGGAYSTDRAPIGNNVVTIDTASIQYGNPASYVAIPEKYNDPEKSGLSADIQPGENENVNFSLEK
jgi:hypothetical protein